MNNSEPISAMPSAWRLNAACVLTALVSASFVTVALAQKSDPAPEIYICVDAKGRRLTSDRKIPECVDREQKVLNPSGTLKTVVPPLLTVREQQALEDKALAEQDARNRPLKEKRRLQALLLRYPNQTVHEKERALALAQAITANSHDPAAKVEAVNQVNSRFDNEHAQLKLLWDQTADSNPKPLK
ncbi:MAG: hypothetical protein FD135_3960 [Comamonadaceae bacterium]|nr:MAG: hypothetical protein FD135_3960 [Comamonadaceae bacterium]